MNRHLLPDTSNGVDVSGVWKGAAMRAILLPTMCGGCGAPGPSPCPRCWSALRPAPAGPTPHGLDDLVALLAYAGPGRELVARVKYRNQRGVLDWLALGLAGLLSDTLAGSGPAVVTWAPTTPSRRRARGFDQAHLLARALARQLGLPVVATLRRRPGPPQTGRTARERRGGGAEFDPLPVGVVAPHGAAGSAGRAPMVLVVDDVVTSGATLSAAAHALRVAGHDRIVGAVAARTPAFGDP